MMKASNSKVILITFTIPTVSFFHKSSFSMMIYRCSLFSYLRMERKDSFPLSYGSVLQICHFEMEFRMESGWKFQRSMELGLRPHAISNTNDEKNAV